METAGTRSWSTTETIDTKDQNTRSTHQIPGRPTDQKTSNQTTIDPIDQTIYQAVDQAIDQTTIGPIDQTIHNSSNKTVDQTTIDPIDQTIDNSSNKTIDQAIHNSSNKTVDQTIDQSSGQTEIGSEICSEIGCRC
jgi:hypothetical protein